jgi:CheY-like chemotaxis protein
MKSAPLILLVEDDDNDVIFLKRAFAKAEISNPLEIVLDGQEAIDYLSGAGKYANRAQFPMPGLVLLDLKMPRKNGMDVLQWVRSQNHLRKLPIIMLTSSVHPEEVNLAYEMGANAFVSKPPGAPERTELARLIKGFWLTMNQLP